MEDVYTIKVKRKPDRRNVYPSERRYSASTVSGLAWVHIALAATSLLLACLAIINPGRDIHDEVSTEPPDEQSAESTTENFIKIENSTNIDQNLYVLILAPSLMAVFALASGVASVVASVRWYIDRNIIWLFIMSILSMAASIASFIMVAIWFASASVCNDEISEFYKEQVPYKNYLLVKNSNIQSTDTHHLVSDNQEATSCLTSFRVLSINILIACFLELLWSILSIKISFNGMRKKYDDNLENRGQCVSVVTTVKGNNQAKSMKNKNIKPVFLSHNNAEFFLSNEKKNETNSEYNERLMNYLNKCADTNSVTITSTNSELNPIPERKPDEERITPSWGDSPNYTIYNQNNLNFDKIFSCPKAKESAIQPSENE